MTLNLSDNIDGMDANLRLLIGNICLAELAYILGNLPFIFLVFFAMHGLSQLRSSSHKNAIGACSGRYTGRVITLTPLQCTNVGISSFASGC